MSFREQLLEFVDDVGEKMAAMGFFLFELALNAVNYVARFVAKSVWWLCTLFARGSEALDTGVGLAVRWFQRFQRPKTHPEFRLRHLPSLQTLPIDVLHIISDYCGPLVTVCSVGRWGDMVSPGVNGEGFLSVLDEWRKTAVHVGFFHTALAYNPGRRTHRLLLSTGWAMGSIAALDIGSLSVSIDRVRYNNLRSVAGLIRLPWLSYDAVEAKLTDINLSVPRAIAIDPLDPEAVIIADDTHRRILWVSEKQNLVRCLAGGDFAFRDGVGTNAGFVRPTGICVQSGGDVLVADAYAGAIRRIARATGQVTTIAGNLPTDENDQLARQPHGLTVAIESDGHALREARFNHPVHICLHPKDDHVVYVASERPTEVDLQCAMEAVFGGEPPTPPSFRQLNLVTEHVVTTRLTGLETPKRISAMAADAKTAVLYLACDRTRSIYRAHPESGECIRLAGTGGSGTADGVGSASEFGLPYALAYGGSINDVSVLFCGDSHYGRIRKILISPLS